MPTLYYKLVDGQPVEAESHVDWFGWRTGNAKNERETIKVDRLAKPGFTFQDISVWTRFEGRPLFHKDRATIFASGVYDMAEEKTLRQYEWATREEAERGHERIVAWYRKYGEAPEPADVAERPAIASWYFWMLAGLGGLAVVCIAILLARS